MSEIMFGVMTDYEYNWDHKRSRLTIWEGPFMGTYVGEAFSTRTGFMITDYNGDKVRVTCPNTRNEDTYRDVDAAINAALSAHFQKEN